MNSELIQEKLRYVNGASYSRVLSELWEREVSFEKFSQDDFRKIYERDYTNIDYFIEKFFEKGEKIFVSYESNTLTFKSETGEFVCNPSYSFTKNQVSYKRAGQRHTSYYSYDRNKEEFFVCKIVIIESDFIFIIAQRNSNSGYFEVCPGNQERATFILDSTYIGDFMNAETLEYLIQVYKHHPINSIEDLNAAIFRYGNVFDISSKLIIRCGNFKCEYENMHLKSFETTIGQKSYKYSDTGMYSVSWPKDVKFEYNGNNVINYSGPENGILETISAMKSEIQEIISKYQYISVKTLDKEEISRMDVCELTEALSKLLGMRFEFESSMVQEEFISAYRNFKRQDILNYVFLNIFRDTDSAIMVRQIEDREFFKFSSDKDTLVLELRWNENNIEKNYFEHKRAEDDFSKFYQLDYIENMICIGYGITEDNFVYSAKKSQISDGETVFSVYSREDYRDIFYISSVSQRLFEHSDIEALMKIYFDFSDYSEFSFDILQRLINELKKFFDVEETLFIGGDIGRNYFNCSFDKKNVTSFDITIDCKKFDLMSDKYFTVSIGYCEIRGFLDKAEIAKSGFANTDEVTTATIIENMKKEFEEVLTKFKSIEF